MAIAEHGVSVEEFLKLPETEPASELWRGKVIQKGSPQGQHGRLQSKLPERFNQFGESRRLAMAFVELRARFGADVFVPDISIYRWDRVHPTQEGKIANQQDPPDVAIEIASPDQSISDLVEKCLEYVANGTEVALLIDPDKEVIFRFGVGGTTLALRDADRIDLDSVRPGFQLTAGEVFALLRRPDAQ